MFIEPRLRLMVPPLAKRTWPPDLVEDAIRSFLLKLLESALPTSVRKLRPYISASFRNHCIDLYEARRSRREHSLEAQDPADEPSTPTDESPAEVASRNQRTDRLHAALTQLSVADRVVLKIEYAPEWMTDQEVGWLADRAGTDSDTVRHALATAADTHALTRIFDPGDDDPGDPLARRDRMERFRQRRTRARDKLSNLLRDVK